MYLYGEETKPTIHLCQTELCQICRACGGKPCPDRNGKASLPCEECHGLFFGSTCLQVHKTNGHCETLHTCTTCCASYRTDKEHACFEAKCLSCEEMEDLREHRCFIQPVEEEGNHPYLSTQTLRRRPNRTFEPNLLCYQTNQERSRIQSLKGENRCREFIKELNKLVFWSPKG